MPQCYIIQCLCCFSSTIYLLTILFHNNRQETVVRIVTRLGARWWWNCGLIPARDKRIFSSPSHPDQLWGLQSPCLVDNVSPFPRKEWLGHEADHLHQVPIRMYGAAPHSPQSLNCMHRESFTFCVLYTYVYFVIKNNFMYFVSRSSITELIAYYSYSAKSLSVV